MKSRTLLAGLIAGATVLFALLLVTGCASTRPNEQALLCPECKIVFVEVMDPHADTSTEPRMREVHSCPGCQGALVTLFKEGKLKHKCSICEGTPYTCALGHNPPED